jgi:hypothetical protein
VAAVRNDRPLAQENPNPLHLNFLQRLG